MFWICLSYVLVMNANHVCMYIDIALCKIPVCVRVHNRSEYRNKREKDVYVVFWVVFSSIYSSQRGRRHAYIYFIIIWWNACVVHFQRTVYLFESGWMSVYDFTIKNFIIRHWLLYVVYLFITYNLHTHTSIHTHTKQYLLVANIGVLCIYIWTRVMVSRRSKWHS